MAPGGSVSNMYALMIARHKQFPEHKKHGMRAIKGQLIMYTSKHVSKKKFSRHFEFGLNSCLLLQYFFLICKSNPDNKHLFLISEFDD